MEERCGICGSDNLTAEYADIAGVGCQRESDWSCAGCGAEQDADGKWHKEGLEDDGR